MVEFFTDIERLLSVTEWPRANKADPGFTQICRSNYGWKKPSKRPTQSLHLPRIGLGS